MDNQTNERAYAMQPQKYSIPYYFDKSDNIFVYIFLAIGLIYPFWYSGFGSNISRTAWLVLYVAAGIIYFACNKRKLTASGGMLSAALVAFAAVFALNSNYYFSTICGLFVSILIPLWLVELSSSSIGSGRLFSDYINSAFVRPFCNIGAFGKAFAKKGTVAVATGVLLALPVIIIAGVFLSSDAAFGGLIEHLFARRNVFTYIIDIFRLIFGSLVGIYLFLAAYGSLCRRCFGITEMKAIDTEQKLKFIPYITACVTLLLISLLYIAYLFSQSAYFFSAFGNILPAGYGYAEYARQGFFELSAVCFINLIVILVAKTLVTNSGGRTIKAYTIGISAFSLLLGVTVIAKLIMYMRFMGLTMARLTATLLSLIMMMTFITIIICTVLRKGMLKPILIAATIMVLAFSFSNPEYQIARFNIAMYESGKHAEIDVDCLLDDLKGKSYMITLPFIKNNESLKMQYDSHIREYFKLSDRPLKSWSVARLYESAAYADYLKP